MNAVVAPSAVQRISVAHIIFRLDIGGLENGLVNVINGLPASKFTHTVICLDTFTDFRRRIRRDDVNVVALNKKPGLHPGLYLNLWRQLRKLRPDIVHTRNLGTLPSVVAAVAARVPVRIHGEHGWDMVDISGRQTKYRILRRLINPLVTVHVAVSRHIVNWLAAVVGIKTDKIIQICNGVDTERFHPRVVANSVQSTPDGEGPLVVGTVGRLEQVKDHKTLIAAVAELKNSRPDLARSLKVRVVGDGSLESLLRNFARDVGVSEILELCGRQDDIPQRLRDMDIFVLPSLNEGISNTILEAMASGLPVVATAVGGNPEIVIEGETGMLVPAGDSGQMMNALIAYLDNPELRARHGRRGRELVEKEMSLSAMVSAYQALYTDSLARFRGHSRGH